MRKILVLGAAAMLAAPAIWTAPAQASLLISIGMQETGYNGGMIFTGATSALTPGNAAYFGGYGTFNFNQITGVGSPGLPQPAFDSTSLQESSTVAGTIAVFVTEQGLTSPTGVSSFISGFSSNLFNGPVTSVIEKTFVSTSNALYGGTLLASATFGGIATTSSTNNTPSLGSVYSETVEYIISVGAGNTDVNDTIDIGLAPTPVPEPISLALLGSGLVGLGFVRARRRG